jgi:hypothetical protein
MVETLDDLMNIVFITMFVGAIIYIAFYSNKPSNKKKRGRKRR